MQKAAFCKIFSGIPHSNIFSALKYVPQIPYLGAYLSVLNVVKLENRGQRLAIYLKLNLKPRCDKAVTKLMLSAVNQSHVN